MRQAMCGRYAVVSKISTIEKRFGVRTSNKEAHVPSANVAVGDLALVITSEKPAELSWFQFGLTPFWAKKNMYLFNARSEGDQNRENDTHYHGRLGILEKPAFRKAIRSQRCLVVADAFIEGPKDKGLDVPFLIYMKDQDRPFAMAGIWDRWLNPLNGAWIESFSIVTSTANSLLNRIGHPRSPVILNKEEEKLWLDVSAPLADITRLLHAPDASRLNAYPISPQIKNAKNKDLHYLQPVGDPLVAEWQLDISHELKLFGMGETNSRTRRNAGANPSGQLDLF